MNRGNATVLILLGVGLFILAGIGTYFWMNPRNTVESPQDDQTTQTPSPTPDASKVEKKPIVVSNDTQIRVGDMAEFDGKVTKINQDLKLFDPENADVNNATYFYAGTFKTGKYAGYKRIIAVAPPMGPGSIDPKIFATKDDKTFILDADPAITSVVPKDFYQSPFSMVNTKVSTSADLIGTSFPETIKINDDFYLSRGRPITTLVSKKIDEKNTNYFYELDLNLSDHPALKSPIGNLNIFGHVSDFSKVNEDGWSKYIVGRNSVYISDSTGLVYDYFLTNKKGLENHQRELRANLQSMIDYYRAKSKGEKVSESGPDTSYINPVGFEFKREEIKTTENLFDVYNAAMPNACGADYSTWVTKNISDDDIMKIGSVNGVDLYKFKDSNHTLIKLEFTRKRTYDQSEEERKDTALQEQRFKEYVAKNPLLLFKDPWGRLTLLGEFQYVLPGGCGKPVIYLYPENPTQVTVTLQQKINFSMTMPTYNQMWKVMASPSGQLTDLLPQNTDCSKIDPTVHGLEYALNACLTKTYPYLFWAGQVQGKQYPKPTGGWVVSSANLSTFLSQKLDEMKFNPTEKKDFLDYWVSQMQLSGASFYRVSFIQTRQMNQFVPMNVTPTPNSVFRVFLDWEPLTSNKLTIAPQTLEQISRSGFTLVEWGGLK